MKKSLLKLYKIFTLLICVVLIAQCSGKDKGSQDNLSSVRQNRFEFFELNGEEENAEFDTLLAQAYWYSRYNIDALALKSQNGFTPTLDDEQKEEISEIMGVDLADIVKARGPNQDPVIPQNSFLLARVLDAGTPLYAQAFGGDVFDFNNFKWLPTDPGSSEKTSWESFAWTLMAEVEWAKHFHDDARFGTLDLVGGGEQGVQERYWGVLLFGQASLQMFEWLRHPEFFEVKKPLSRYLILQALSRFADMVRADYVPHSGTTNRLAETADIFIGYYFPDADSDYYFLEKMLNQKMDELYSDLPAVKTPEDIHVALSSLSQYAYYRQDKRSEILARFGEIAGNLENLETKTFLEKVHLLCALLEANRITRKIIYLRNAIPLAQSLLEQYQSGSFEGLNSYSTAEIAWIVRALNMLRLFGGNFVNQDSVEAVLADFFEEIINKGRLQLSALKKESFKEYERGEDSHHRHSYIPLPEQGGGEHGVAPVFARGIEKGDLDTDPWRISESIEFQTAPAMHLTVELLWLHRDKVDGFSTLPWRPSSEKR